MSAADRLSRRALLRASVAAPAVGLLAGCGSAPPRRVEVAPDERGLLDAIALADLDHDGPFVELGSAAKDRHVLGGWRSGWGDDRAVDGRRATMIDQSPALIFLEHPGGPRELRLGVRAAAERVMAIYVGDTLVGEHTLGAGWTTLRATLPDQPAGPLVVSIRHGGAPGEPAFAVSHLHLARPGADDDPPRLEELLVDGASWSLRAPTRLSFHLDVDRPTWLEADVEAAGAPGALRVWQTPARTGEAARRASLELGSAGTLRARLAPDGLSRVTVEVSGAGARARLSRPRLSSAPAPKPARLPRVERVLVVLCDTLRADRLRAYAPDTRVHAPAFDRLAREGVVFERCVTPANWTKPACASLLTGRAPARHGAVGRDDPLPATVPTLAEGLREAGWSTGAFVANGFISEELGFARGFDRFESSIDDAPRNRAGDVFARARAWIRAHRGRPTFVYAHCVDPHVPYEPAPSDLARYDPEPYAGPLGAAVTGAMLEAVRRGELVLEERDRRRLEALYDGEVTGLDRELGRLLDGLREDGWLEDALVVVVADHGEELLDHGSVGHGHSLQEELQHVPLLVRPPGGGDGRRAPQLVSLTDLAPTIFDAARVAPPEGMDGRSLAAELRGGAPPPDLAAFCSQWAAERGDELKWSARIGDHKLWTLGPLEPHLHDLAADPEEQRALTSPIAQRALTARLGGHIAELRRRGRVTARPPTAPLSEELCERLRAMGYVDVGRCE
ncbi:MAG: sulfatase [Sandaracinaceae bacterium]|nr:sulfatase [Sandaracinaceae bacterium]